jgi:zinc-binding alcohol dehydrogenase family protein
MSVVRIASLSRRSRITLAEPVADQFVAVTWHGAWLRTQSAGVPVMLCAEVGIPHGLDHLVQAVEDFLDPAAYQWVCRYGSDFFQGQPSGNDPPGAVRLGVQQLAPLVELSQAGKITTVIDRRFALSEVPEALRYLGEGHAKGKVVVTVG